MNYSGLSGRMPQLLQFLAKRSPVRPIQLALSTLVPRHLALASALIRINRNSNCIALAPRRLSLAGMQDTET